jgi:hypothetical protein
LKNLPNIVDIEEVKGTLRIGVVSQQKKIAKVSCPMV